MKELTIAEILRILAKGVNPETGEIYPEWMSLHKEVNKRYLNKVADEIENADENTGNRTITRPLHKRWTLEELKTLMREYISNMTIHDIAVAHDRSETAIIMKLIRSGVCSEQELIPVISPELQERVDRIIQRDKEKKEETQD